MKLIKLLIPLLISYNLAIGEPILNKDITNHQSWELEKSQERPEDIIELERFNHTFIEYLKKNFYGKQANNFIIDKEECNITAIIKSNELTNLQKFEILDLFEENLNEFNFTWNSENKYRRNFYFCANVIGKSMTHYEYFHQNFINYGFSRLYNLINDSVNPKDRRASATIKYFKKSSFQFLRDLKKSYKKLKRPLLPDHGKDGNKN